MSDLLPRFAFLPALPLAKPLDLGEWRVGTPPPEVGWRSDRFKELAGSLLGSFEKVGLKGGAVFWHRDRGIDGTTPEGEALLAMQAAIRYGRRENPSTRSSLSLRPCARTKRDDCVPAR